MSFGLDNKYQAINFEELSVDDLEIVSGGSGLSAPYVGGLVSSLGVGAAGGVVGIVAAFAVYNTAYGVGKYLL